MRFTELSGALILLGACSMTLIPEGAAEGASSQQEGEWTAGSAQPSPVPATNTPANTQTSPRTRFNVSLAPVASNQIVRVAADETRASGSGIALGPQIANLGIRPDRATKALRSFRTSCSSLVRRTDQSGLTQGSDWQLACDASKGWQDNDGLRFFESYFEAVQISDGKAFATGYFEPQIQGSCVCNENY